MTYRVGIVGASGITINTPSGAPPSPLDKEVFMSHVGCLSIIPDMEVTAICDIVPEALDRFKKNWGTRWPNARTYVDYRDMLANEELDILTVATSDNRHTQIVIDGARSGVKGIFCEKPIATTIEDADAMIAACEENGVKMSVNHTRRWSPIFHKVRGAIRRGTIGPLSSITAELGGPRAMMFRNGTHLIDAICFFAESKPTRVSALLEDGFDHWDRYRGDGGKLPENEPGATGLVLFENGIRALFRGTKGTLSRSTLELTGPMGQISVAGDEPTAELIMEGDGPLVLVRKSLRSENYQVHGMVAAYKELVDIIERGGESISSPRDARTALQIMLGFLDSHQDGSRLVKVPG